MNKVRVKRGNPDKPSDTEIEVLRDFNALRTNYQEALHNLHRKPIYKNPKFFIVLLIILLIAYLLSEVREKPERSTDGKHIEEPIGD